MRREPFALRIAAIVISGSLTTERGRRLRSSAIAHPAARFIAIVCGFIFLAAGIAPAAFGATITVTNTNDSGAGSLRQALAGSANGDYINFSISPGQTITLASTLPIATNVTIDGAGAPGLIVNGSHAVGVFNVNFGTTATLSRLTIANGSAGFGGGINNQSTLIVSNCTLSGNSAGTSGGAINNQGNLTVINSTFSGNDVGSFGFGGAINNLSATLTVINSTFVGNGHFSVAGGGVENFSGTVTIRNSLFVNNADSAIDGAATVDQDLAWNSGACGGCITGDPMLGSLTDNGGPTPTFLPALGGAATNAGNDAFCAGFDQRGLPRVQGVHCDIGAVELVLGQVCYVNAAATGANTGASWSDAYTDLQSALDPAANCIEAWVAEGVYKPAGIALPDPTISFRIFPGKQIYGGFAGTEVLRTARNPTTNVTVLSGDIDNNDCGPAPGGCAGGVDIDASQIVGSNSHSVVQMDGTTANGLIFANTVLDGFVITAGAGGSTGIGDGGGLFCEGMNLAHVCSPALANLVFSGNRASFGGALLNRGESSGVSSPTLTNVTFAGNSASVAGGAMYDDAGNSGGISSPTLNNVTFNGNSASVGGAMYNTGYYGGTSNPTLANVTFFGNSSSNGAGAMFNGGGGIPGSFGFSSPTLDNVTFSGNSSAIAPGAMLNSSGSPRLNNVILWGDTVAAAVSEILNSSATPTITYSIIQGSGGSASWNSALGADGGNNLDADPKLGSLQNNGGFTQTMFPGIASAAENMGNDSICGAAPVYGLDQRGFTRPQGTHCDIGAVETDRIFGGDFD